MTTISAKSDVVTLINVFTVEPGLYEAGWGGIRIEDVVIMSERGPINITRAPKGTLQEVG